MDRRNNYTNDTTWIDSNFTTSFANLNGGLRYTFPVTVFYCVAYTAVFVVGLTGNCFVVSVVYRSPWMRSPTNLFIANLACADLLVTVICVPFTLVSNVTTAWPLGWFMCKTIPYLQGVSVNASVNTLVAISVERCLAICYPMKWHVTNGTVRLALVIIWAISLSITLPWAVYFQLQPLDAGSEYQTCNEDWPTSDIENVYFVVANLFLCYFVPLILILICYVLIWRRVWRRKLPGEQHEHGEQAIHRSKMKVIKMLLVVVVLFACSWLPLYTIITRLKFGGPLSPTEAYLIDSFIPVAQWLGSSNSCINPILYAFFNRKFRAGFKAVLSSRSCCSTLRYDYKTQMTITLPGTVRKGPPTKRMTISAGVPVSKPPKLAENPRTMSLRTPTNYPPNNNFFFNQDNIKTDHDLGSFV